MLTQNWAQDGWAKGAKGKRERGVRFCACVRLGAGKEILKGNVKTENVNTPLPLCVWYKCRPELNVIRANEL